jgi:predicted nuclease of predicted toxin-antitoxin system
MRLLFDENLSSKLPNRLGDLFPNSLHVRDVGMKATIDPIVWNYFQGNRKAIAQPSTIAITAGYN